MVYALNPRSILAVQGRKLRKSIVDMQNGHEAQVNAIMDKYNSLRAKVSVSLPQGIINACKGDVPNRLVGDLVANAACTHNPLAAMRAAQGGGVDHSSSYRHT